MPCGAISDDRRPPQVQNSKDVSSHRCLPYFLYVIPTTSLDPVRIGFVPGVIFETLRRIRLGHLFVSNNSSPATSLYSSVASLELRGDFSPTYYVLGTLLTCHASQTAGRIGSMKRGVFSIFSRKLFTPKEYLVLCLLRYFSMVKPVWNIRRAAAVLRCHQELEAPCRARGSALDQVRTHHVMIEMCSMQFI